MEILTAAEVVEWTRQDIDVDSATFRNLQLAARAHVEHITGRILTKATCPEALKHAMLVFIAAHYDDRAGSNEAAMKTVRSLCLPYWVARP